MMILFFPLFRGVFDSGRGVTGGYIGRMLFVISSSLLLNIPHFVAIVKAFYIFFTTD